MEDALHDWAKTGEFSGINLQREATPAGTSVCKLCLLLERHETPGPLVPVAADKYSRRNETSVTKSPYACANRIDDIESCRQGPP